MELVAKVVSRYNIEEQDVLGLRIQAGHLELHLGKHLPGTNMVIFSFLNFYATFR